MERPSWPADVRLLSLVNRQIFDNYSVGSLLDVPTHTVNMTTLRSTHELWHSYSMDPPGVCFFYLCFFPNLSYVPQAHSTSTLAEFLIDNEGQRCVVVLDVSTPSIRHLANG